MDHSFLGQDLRRADYDRYLLSLFAPAYARAGLWGLFLLDHEIARTRDTVTETRLGHIRLQWWRDEISKMYDTEACGQIPVLSTIAPFIRSSNIPKDWFDSLIYAHEFDLEDVAPGNVTGLRHYADFTTTPVHKIALKMMGEVSSEEEIRHISTNFGLFRIIRSVPYMLSRRRCYLPLDLLESKNLTPAKIIDFNHKDDIIDVLKILVRSIEAYRKPQSAFLHKCQALSMIYLKYFGKNGFDVFSSQGQTLPPFLAARLWLS